MFRLGLWAIPSGAGASEKAKGKKRRRDRKHQSNGMGNAPPQIWR
jgi:hypothetical protein